MPDCGSGCAMRSIRLTGLLLFGVCLIHPLCFCLFVYLIAIIKRYSEQLLMDTRVVALPALEISVMPRVG